MAKKSDDEKHLYGRHYTPPPVAALLAAFAINSPRDLVLDPSCGDGRLIKAALDAEIYLQRLEPQSSGINEPSKKLIFGIEMSDSAVRQAAEFQAELVVADFFDIVPGSAPGGARDWPGQFDAIIGNPPYIRQELLGQEKKARILAALSSDNGAQVPNTTVKRNRRVSGESRLSNRSGKPIEWSARSDIYVYFFAHASRLLKHGGRLVFITASSWLDSGYGVALKQFLLDNFCVTALIESAVESFFDGASVNTVITVLRKEPDHAERLKNVTRFVSIHEPLERVFGTTDHTTAAISLAAEITNTQESTSNHRLRVRLVPQASLIGAAFTKAENSLSNATKSSSGFQSDLGYSHANWSRYLRAEDIFFRILDKGGSRLRTLAEVGSVRFGIKTGANEFFYVRNHNDPLTPFDENSGVGRVRRGITTGANDFFYVRKIHENGNGLAVVENKSGRQFTIERRFLTPVIFSLKEIATVVFDPASGSRLLFNCAEPKSALAGTHAIDYVTSGEESSFHLRPTCRARDPWYSAIRGMKPAPLIFPSKVGERWLVAINKASVYEDKKLYGIFPGVGVDLELLAALLNSTWARYYTEITCRQLTGAQAIADIDVVVAEQILLPDPFLISEADRSELCAVLNSIAQRPVKSVFEEVHLSDRRALDDAVLRAIGFENRSERERACEDLYNAVTSLVRSRLDRKSL